MILGQLLSEVFSQSEIKHISDEWLNSRVSLTEVEDIDSFLAECEFESKSLKVAGPHRLQDWEEGWSGAGIADDCIGFPNIPYYFKKNKYVRIGGSVYKDLSGLTELILLRCIQDVALSYVRGVDASAIIEYGCGTGHNLEYFDRRVQGLNIYAADWAESAIDHVVKMGIASNSRAFRVDYFDPTSYQAPKEPFVACTVASLEQTGENYAPFMSFLSENRLCRAVFHIEPIRDLILPDSRLNEFSISYSERRGYLKDFYHYVKSSNIRILVAKDFGLGSKFLSGYQLLIWSR